MASVKKTKRKHQIKSDIRQESRGNVKLDSRNHTSQNITMHIMNRIVTVAVASFIILSSNYGVQLPVVETCTLLRTQEGMCAGETWYFFK